MLSSLIWLLLTINYQYVSSYIFNNLCGCTISVHQASPAYTIGTSKTGNDGTYTSMTDNPLGPWNGESIHFQGTNNGNFIIYNYKILCNVPCWITSITVQGVAFWDPNMLTLYPLDGLTILNDKNLSGGNTFKSHTLDISTNEHYSNTFYLTESNNICCWRYRSLINMTMIPRSTSLPNNICGCSISVISAASTWHITTSYSGFKSTSIDPLAPWYGQSVQFKGTNGNDAGDVQIYDYEINCIQSCWISNVNIQGAAWGDSQFTLYDGDKSNILGTMSVNDGNVFRSFDLDTTQYTPFYGKHFRFIETNTDSDWRYRSMIAITMNLEPTLNPTTISTNNPRLIPTNNPTPSPTTIPSSSSTMNTPEPTPITVSPTTATSGPTATDNPTPAPTDNPTPAPTNNPTAATTNDPTPAPTENPTASPITTATTYTTIHGKWMNNYIAAPPEGWQVIANNNPINYISTTTSIRSYDGPFESITDGLDTYYLYQSFYCAQTSSVEVTYHVVSCGTDSSDYVQFLSSTIRGNTTSSFTDSGLNTICNDQWRYQGPLTDNLPSSVAVGSLFNVTFQINIDGNHGVMGFANIQIQCIPPTTSPTTAIPTLYPTTIPSSSPTMNTHQPTAITVSPTTATSGPTSDTVSPTVTTPGPTANTPSPTSITPGPTANTVTALPTTGNTTTGTPMTGKPTLKPITIGQITSKQPSSEATTKIAANTTLNPTTMIATTANGINSDDITSKLSIDTTIKDNNMDNEVRETTDGTVSNMDADISNDNKHDIDDQTMRYIITATAGAIILLSCLSCLVCIVTICYFRKKNKNDSNPPELHNVLSTDSIMSVNDLCSVTSVTTPNDTNHGDRDNQTITNITPMGSDTDHTNNEDDGDIMYQKGNHKTMEGPPPKLYVVHSIVDSAHIDGNIDDDIVDDIGDDDDERDDELYTIHTTETTEGGGDNS